MLRLRGKHSKKLHSLLSDKIKNLILRYFSCFRRNSEKTYDDAESKFCKSEASITGKNLLRIKEIKKI